MIRPSRHARLLSFLLLLALVPRARATLSGDDFNANTITAINTLQQWYNGSGLWTSTGWWNAANCVDALESAIAAGNGLNSGYLNVLTNTFNLNSGGNFLNGYYDDEGWWAEAWIRAYDLTGNPQFLNMAKTIFNDMTGGWDTSSCGGGVWWDKVHSYKNAIPNELFLLAAIRLHQRTPSDGTGVGSYYYWATNEWSWFTNSGMINAQHLINDGLTTNCLNNGKTTWTYNQGVILAGLTDLYKVTGNSTYLTTAETIADAALNGLKYGNGVLKEPCEPSSCGGGDVPQFKGIFIRHLAYLYDTDHKASYFNFLYTNAHSIWSTDRNSTNQLGLRWTGPLDSADAARQSSAIMPISSLAQPTTALLPFTRGAADPSFNHTVGQAAPPLGWTCNPSIAPFGGLMQYGPYLASLPAGLHTVHYRLAVDSLSNVPSNLVQLVVLSQNITAAVTNLVWSQFAEANQAEDFAVIFNNTSSNNVLEFRATWMPFATAPALTLTDITIDGAHNWTAANLAHNIGRLDGFNGWEADSVRDLASGYLALGPSTSELSPGFYSAKFELRVDNFNWDSSTVATLSVVNVDSNIVVASQSINRNQFPDTLYHTFALNFQASAGTHYDFRTFWNYGPNAPRLTQRSVVVTATGAAGFVPIGLASSSFNQDMVIEHNAPAIPGGAYTTASMDAGTANTANGWYERGYDSAAPATGLPLAGSTITNQSASDHVYTFAPSYAAPNAAFVDSTHSAVITPAAADPFAALSFLTAAGHGPVLVDYAVHHADGSTEPGTFSSPDWFFNTASAYVAKGRVDVGTGSFNSVNSGNPNLYAADITLTNSASPVTSINLSWDSANTGSRVAAIFAVSGLAPLTAPSGLLVTPLAQTQWVGTVANFSVSAGSGTPPFFYQWALTGSPIPGATNSALVLASLSTNDSGTYTCIVANNGGSTASPAATLTVLPLPVLVSAWSNGILTLTWTNGTLLEATNVLGPWLPDPSAASPFQITPTAPSMFYRLQVQ
jgi:predicted alpha-1,6-mannanase (GH76 family)